MRKGHELLLEQEMFLSSFSHAHTLTNLTLNICFILSKQISQASDATADTPQEITKKEEEVNTAKLQVIISCACCATTAAECDTFSTKR